MPTSTQGPPGQAGFPMGVPVLAVLLVAAFALRAGSALLWPNLFWPDEIFQSLEPAHRMAFGHGMESFEWRIGLRSPVFPALLAAVMEATAWLADGSVGYRLGCVVVLSALSVFSVLSAALLLRGHGRFAPVLGAVLIACWFDLVYFAPKALTEVVAGHLVLPALAFGVTAGHPARIRMFLAGLLLGLAAAIRPHVAPGIGMAGLWLLWRTPRGSWLSLVVGGLLPSLCFGVVDWIAYGRPFHSLLVNVTFNVGENRSLDYGWLPKHYYAVYLWQTWTPPVAVTFLALWLVSLRRLMLPALVAGMILFSHSMLGHKEYRFVYPALPLLLVGVAAGAARVVSWLPTGRQKVSATVMACLFVVVSALAAVDFHQGKTPTGMSGLATTQSHWTADRNVLLAMEALSRRPDVRGVALTGILWQFSGGYTWLHHDVPLYFVDLAETPAPAWPHVNYVLVRGEQVSVPTEFVEVQRLDDVRILHRSGTVVVREGYSVNDVLRQRKE